MASAPTQDEIDLHVTVPQYHRKMLDLVRTHGRPATIEEVADALGISFNHAVKLQHKVDNIKKDAKDVFDKGNRLLQSDKLASLGHQPHQAPRDPNDPFSFGGRKSRRYGKKSRRHGKKSRRHSKKSSKRSCRR